MRILALVVARKGSKGLPGKNYRKFAGKPLCQWGMEAALNSNKIDEICISTDCENVISVARDLGINVPFVRPSYLASDDSKVIDTISHAIEFYKKRSQYFDFIVLIQPTSPLLFAEDVDKAIEIISSHKEADTLITLARNEHIHPNLMYVKDKEGFLTRFSQSQGEMSQRQELADVYARSGLIYIFKPENIFKGSIYGNRIVSYDIPSYSTVDIDDIHDFELGEFIKTKKWDKRFEN